AVLRVEDEGLHAVVVEAVRPSEVGALHRAIQRLSGTLGVVFVRERFGPERVELIAIVHRDEERVVVPRDRRHLTKAGGEARPILLLLIELVLVELPDAAVLLENGAGILPRHARLSILGLAGVRWRADVDVESALAIEGDALVLVLTIARQAGDDRLRHAGRLELSRRQLDA